MGVVANPASGRDIRRIVTGASVFDNAEKGSMVYRLLLRPCRGPRPPRLEMPAGSGLSEALRRRAPARDGRLPELELLDQRLEETAADTVVAVREMRARGVSAIVVLGGDGTNRIVAKHCGAIPLCALSTGTNSVFPELREATVAGLATGLVASGCVGTGARRREKMIHIARDGDPRFDFALVNVAVTSEPWLGARAVWRISEVSEIFVSFARPDAVGLSAIAGQLEPVARGDEHGLRVRLADRARQTSSCRWLSLPGGSCRSASPATNGWSPSGPTGCRGRREPRPRRGARDRADAEDGRGYGWRGPVRSTSPG